MSRTEKISYDHLGNEFPSVSKMCAHYGITRTTFYHRLNRGSTLEQALTKPIGERSNRNLKSPEEQREYNHARRVAYYHAHREKALADSKAYYQAHREKCLEYQAQYRLKHNDYYRGYQAAMKKYKKGEL